MKLSHLVPWRSSLPSSPSPYWSIPRSFDADRFEYDIDELMRDFDSDDDLTQAIDFGARSFPSVDLKETAESYSVEAELPGLSEKDVELEVVNNCLFIKGEGKKETNTDDGYICTERNHGPFCRKVTFGEEVNLESINAEMKNGVLHVNLEKKNIDVTQIKKIEIRQ